MDIISRRSPQATYREIEKLIESKKWDKVLHLISKSKGKKRKGLQSVLQSSQSAVSILSLAIVHDAPFSIIEVILELNPELASHTDLHGMTPLHITCACRGSSLEIIQLLLQIDNGASANMVDKSERTPLHHLITYICYPRPEELEMFMNDEGFSISSHSFSEAHESSGHDDKNSIVSMNQNEFSNASFAMADLFQAAPLAMYVRDSLGNTPIDILHECKVRQPKSPRPTPKWERADITTKMLREEIVAFYRESKKTYEKQGFVTAKRKSNQSDNGLNDGSTSSSTVQETSLGSNPTHTDASTLLNFADMSCASQSTRLKTFVD